MTGEALCLFAVGALLLVSSLQVVLSKNLFHSVLWLALTRQKPASTSNLLVILPRQALSPP